MSCPVCGGSSREAIAPNYWRCTHQLERSVLLGVQAVGPIQQPVYDTVREPCGNEYHEGAPPAPSSPMCKCGTFAIGQCTECHEWRCGDHSSTRYGPRLCGTHLAREREEHEKAQRAQIEQRARAEELRRAVEAEHKRRHGLEFFETSASSKLAEANAPTRPLLQAHRRTVVKKNHFVIWFVNENKGKKFIEVEDWEPAGRVWVSAVVAQDGTVYGVPLEPQRHGLPAIVELYRDQAGPAGEAKRFWSTPHLGPDALERLAIAVNEAAGLPGWRPGACSCDARVRTRST